MSITDIIKAADFAARKHKDQRRKDPDSTPYINHPIGVAHILTEEGTQGCRCLTIPLFILTLAL